MPDQPNLGEFLYVTRNTGVSNLDVLVEQTGLENGFWLENLPGIKSDFVIWCADYNIRLYDEKDDYLFSLKNHEAEFEENGCLSNERYIFDLNKGDTTHLKLVIDLIGYSDRDGDTSGISSTRMQCELYSDEELPKALFEMLSQHLPQN
jgi:hypothetical protein